MKKILLLALLFVFLCTTACSTALERDKKQMLKTYCSDENYISLSGEIVEIANEENKLTIKCKDSKLPSSNDDTCEYLVFADTTANLKVGDTIVYTTVKEQIANYSAPIVAITKDDKEILDFQTGKENLINWVNQLQAK